MSVKIVYKTKNIIEESWKPCINRDKYINIGTYQLKCPAKKYTRQTGRSFCQWHKEHFRDFKNGSSKSSFANHLLDNAYSTGPTEDVKDVLHITNHGAYRISWKGSIHIQTKKN